jgi:cellulose synthase operon protein C
MFIEEAPSVRPQPDTDALKSLQSLYDAARYRDAWLAVQGLAPMEQWTSTTALVLAGRLVSNWGNTALSNRLHLRAHRQSPHDDTAFYYFILTLHSKHGAFEALRVLSERTATFNGDPDTLARADLWLQQARLLCVFRDFYAAESCIARVERSFPRYAWLWTEKSGLLREQDRYEESLAAADEALRLRPWYRPAVQARVHLLQLLNRDDEALALLEESRARLQCGSLVQTLVLALEEKARHADMLVALELLAELHPLETKDYARWRAARRCDAAYRLGDMATALASAREAGPGYYEKIVQRLSADPAPDARRVLLPVGFVRQHHMTCAPATMAALSRYWERPVDHLALAREICYDGTPAHLERSWAEQHGWLVREFRVTWDITRALIDRGCPFAIVTVGIRNGHMQALIGYDSRLGTLLIRDPYQRSYGEWQAEAFFESHASSGPRGFLMLPPEKASLLDGLELPDEVFHDGLHKQQLALSRHDRATAAAALASLQAADANHLLTLKARYELACYYDSNFAQALVPLRALRERFPDDANFQLDEMQLLSQLGLTDEHRALLRRWGNRPAAPVIFMRMEAEELIRDARNHPRAFKLLRRALRRQASDARTLAALAGLLQENNRHAEAVRLHRLAACAADKVEHHWNSYFQASRHLRETDESLALLRRRFEVWGDRSGQPARTLFESLEALNLAPEAFVVLDTARARRPDDGELLLFAADAHGRYARYDEAAHLMEAAAPKAPPSAWRRTAAAIANYQGDHALALSHWREILALNPADTFAHNSVARLLSIVEGRAAVILHLETACEEQPHLLPLRQTLVQWLHDESLDRALAALDTLLAMDPANAWALREKSIILRRLQRTADALACAEEALRIAPFAPASHGIRADALKQLGRLEEAREGYRAGIRLSVDADWLFNDLVSACPDFATRREAVMFLRDELLRQTSLDNASLQYRAVARSILTPEELRITLEALWTARPDSWSTWSVLVAHLLDQGELPAALAKASDAATRFPLTPRIWLDLANVHGQTGDTDSAVRAYEKALAISPAWSVASRQLSKIHERTLRMDLAEEVLRRAISLAPTDAYNHGWLADILWRRHQHQDALTAMEKSVSLMPDFEWAWGRIDVWGRETGDATRAIRLAETLTQTRPGEAEAWLRLVRLRFTDHEPGANLAALDRAEALAPRNIDVHDLRAELLATRKCYDEAMAACHPAVFGDAVPHLLEGRAAWIEYHRGRFAKAIDRMAAVTAAHPDYLWGWSLLTKWYWADKKFESVKTAAARWAWLAPEASLPHGYIATVHKQDGRKKDAKEALARSIVADPTYEFGAFELLRLQLDDGEFAETVQTLRHIETHFPPADHLQAVILKQRAGKEREAAGETLQKIGRLPGLQEASLQESVNLVMNAGWELQVETAFAPLLSDSATLPVIGRHWMRARQKKSFWLGLWKLRRLRPTPAHRREIDMSIVENLGEAKRVLALRLFCRLRRRTLRAHDETWAQVGYAFNGCQRFRSVVRWMSDWRERPEAPPWMYFNLIQSLYSRKKVSEAREVLAAALRRPPDHTHDKLLGWLACEQALDGDTAAALATTDRINASQFTDYYQALAAFTQCMIKVQQAAPDAKREALYDAKVRLRTEVEKLPAICTASALSQFYRRTQRRLGQDGGSLWWRVRSRLPLFKPSAPASSGMTVTPGMIWLIVIVLSGAMRACVGAMH